MNDKELNEHIKNLIQGNIKNEDSVVKFLLSSLKEASLNFEEVTKQLQSVQKNITELQKNQIGFLANRIAYINDIKKRVQEITQTEGEENETK